MLYILHCALNDNEVKFLRYLMESLECFPFEIVDISNEINVNLDNNKVIVSFDITKTESGFSKRFREVFKDTYDNFRLKKGIDLFHLPRPNTLAKNQELQKELWKSLSAFIPITITNDYLPLLNNQLLTTVIENIKKENSRQVYKVKMEHEDKYLEIVPDDYVIKHIPSVTYTEFFNLLLIKSLFKTDKIIIE